MFVCVCVCLSVCVFVSVCMFVCLYLYLCLCQCICLYVCPTLGLLIIDGMIWYDMDPYDAACNQLYALVFNMYFSLVSRQYSRGKSIIVCFTKSSYYEVLVK